MPEFTEQVTRTEIFHVSEAVLNRERMFQKGKADRKAGQFCRSPNGAYVNGWNSPDTDYYYITASAAHLL